MTLSEPTALEDTMELIEQAESLMISLEMRIEKAITADTSELYRQWLEVNERAMDRGADEEEKTESRALLKQLIETMRQKGVTQI